MTVRRILIPAVFALLVAVAVWLREEPASKAPARRPGPVEALAPVVPETETKATPGSAEPAPVIATPVPTPAAPPGMPPAATPLVPWRPGYMGLNGQDQIGGGALVTQVFPYTAAAQEGIRVGDVILEFNGRAVPNLATLFDWARNTGEGTPVSLRIRRGGSEIYIGLQLGRHPLYN